MAMTVNDFLNVDSNTVALYTFENNTNNTATATGKVNFTFSGTAGSDYTTENKYLEYIYDEDIEKYSSLPTLSASNINIGGSNQDFSLDLLVSFTKSTAHNKQTNDSIYHTFQINNNIFLDIYRASTTLFSRLYQSNNVGLKDDPPTNARLQDNSEPSSPVIIDYKIIEYYSELHNTARIFLEYIHNGGTDGGPVLIFSYIYYVNKCDISNVNVHDVKLHGTGEYQCPIVVQQLELGQPLTMQNLKLYCLDGMHIHQFRVSKVLRLEITESPLNARDLPYWFKCGSNVSDISLQPLSTQPTQFTIMNKNRITFIKNGISYPYLTQPGMPVIKSVKLAGHIIGTNTNTGETITTSVMENVFYGSDHHYYYYYRGAGYTYDFSTISFEESHTKVYSSQLPNTVTYFGGLCGYPQPITDLSMITAIPNISQVVNALGAIVFLTTSGDIYVSAALPNIDGIAKLDIDFKVRMIVGVRDMPTTAYNTDTANHMQDRALQITIISQYYNLFVVTYHHVYHTDDTDDEQGIRVLPITNHISIGSIASSLKFNVALGMSDLNYITSLSLIQDNTVEINYINEDSIECTTTGEIRGSSQGNRSTYYLTSYTLTDFETSTSTTITTLINQYRGEDAQYCDLKDHYPQQKYIRLSVSKNDTYYHIYKYAKTNPLGTNQKSVFQYSSNTVLSPGDNPVTLWNGKSIESSISLTEISLPIPDDSDNKEMHITDIRPYSGYQVSNSQPNGSTRYNFMVLHTTDKYLYQVSEYIQAIIPNVLTIWHQYIYKIQISDIDYLLIDQRLVQLQLSSYLTIQNIEYPWYSDSSKKSIIQKIELHDSQQPSIKFKIKNVTVKNKYIVISVTQPGDDINTRILVINTNSTPTQLLDIEETATTGLIGELKYVKFSSSYSTSNIRTKVDELYNHIEPDLKKIIVPTKHKDEYYDIQIPINPNDSTVVHRHVDENVYNLFLPSQLEITNIAPTISVDTEDTLTAASSQTQYEYYQNGGGKTAAGKKKYKHNATSTAASYWLRDVTYQNNQLGAACINTLGSSAIENQRKSLGMAPVFIIS